MHELDALRVVRRRGRARAGAFPAVIDAGLMAVAARAGDLLRRRGETIGVAEGSCGGLVSAALLAVPGASAYHLGGTVIYTPRATRAFLAPALTPPSGARGATEEFATYLAAAVAKALQADWGIGEGGATGPSPNPYGDPPGHAWVAVGGPRSAARHLLTGRSDREENMVAFATAALTLLVEQLEG